MLVFLLELINIIDSSFWGEIFNYKSATRDFKCRFSFAICIFRVCFDQLSESVVIFYSSKVSQ